MSRATEESTGALMQGLIYPALLGAAFIWTITAFTSQYEASGSIAALLKVENCFAIWLLAYFCVPFLVLTRANLPKRYCWLSFATDIGDVAAIYFAFLGLGFVSAGSADMSVTYKAIAAIPVLAAIGNKSVGRPIKWAVSVTAFLIAVAMAFQFHSSDAFNCLAIIALSVIQFFYIKDAAA